MKENPKSPMPVLRFVPMPLQTTVPSNTGGIDSNPLFHPISDPYCNQPQLQAPISSNTAVLVWSERGALSSRPSLFPPAPQLQIYGSGSSNYRPSGAAMQQQIGISGVPYAQCFPPNMGAGYMLRSSHPNNCGGFMPHLNPTVGRTKVVFGFSD